MGGHSTIEAVKTYQTLPENPSGVKDGLYAIRHSEYLDASAQDDQIQSKNWFKSPPLTVDIIRRIYRLELWANSRDQGSVGDKTQGNWTWFDLAIFEDSSATSPKIQDGVELVWTSHGNRIETDEYGWESGDVFGKSHDLFRCLEENNVIGVMLCARFKGWKIMANDGYLVFELGPAMNERAGPTFKPILENINAIQDYINEANTLLNIPEKLRPTASTATVRANDFNNPERPLKVLSLDGGGIRGLSSLYILKEVMDKISPGKTLKPCDVFDMIAGTSAGGLIAIMLGRLKMSVDECIQAYQKLAVEVFTKSVVSKFWEFLWDRVLYDEEELERRFKVIIRDRMSGNQDANLFDENEKGGCKVFVVTVREDAGNNREPILLRSYKNPDKELMLPDCKIWQAARATSAAPVYFNGIDVGQYKLVDGGLASNNPLGWVWNEVLDVYTAAREIDCFLSIGTGIPQNVRIGKAGWLDQREIIRGLAGAATNSQLTHVLFKALINSYAPKSGNQKYWRLNIGKHIQKPGQLDNYVDIGEMDSVKMIGKLRDMTREYINDPDSRNIIDGAARTLAASP